jgi:hypothetical protein
MGLYILIIHIQALNLLQYSCTRYLHTYYQFNIQDKENVMMHIGKLTPFV